MPPARSTIAPPAATIGFSLAKSEDMSTMQRGVYAFSPYAIPTALTTLLMLVFSWRYYPGDAALTSVPFLASSFGHLFPPLGESVLARHRSGGTGRIRIRMLILALGIASPGSVGFSSTYGVRLYRFGYLALF